MSKKKNKNKNRNKSSNKDRVSGVVGINEIADTEAAKSEEKIVDIAEAADAAPVIEETAAPAEDEIIEIAEVPADEVKETADEAISMPADGAPVDTAVSEETAASKDNNGSEEITEIKDLADLEDFAEMKDYAVIESFTASEDIYEPEDISEPEAIADPIASAGSEAPAEPETRETEKKRRKVFRKFKAIFSEQPVTRKILTTALVITVLVNAALTAGLLALFSHNEKQNMPEPFGHPGHNMFYDEPDDFGMDGRYQKQGTDFGFEYDDYDSDDYDYYDYYDYDDYSGDSELLTPESGQKGLETN